MKQLQDEVDVTYILHMLYVIKVGITHIHMLYVIEVGITHIHMLYVICFVLYMS